MKCRPFYGFVYIILWSNVVVGTHEAILDMEGEKQKLIQTGAIFYTYIDRATWLFNVQLYLVFNITDCEF